MDYEKIQSPHHTGRERGFEEYPRLSEKQIPQSAGGKNVWDDYIQTRKTLERSAGSLQEPESEQLQERGLKRINFLRHSYFMLYEMEEETAVIVKVFHSLEDYENELK